MDSVQWRTGFHTIGEKVTVDAFAARTFYQVADIKIKAVCKLVCHGRESFKLMLDHFPIAPWLVYSTQIASPTQHIRITTITGPPAQGKTAGQSLVDLRVVLLPAIGASMHARCPAVS